MRNSQARMSDQQQHLERLERRLERRWYDLAQAEQRGQPAQVLERMYTGYLRVLDEYIACQRAGIGRASVSRLAS